MITIAAASIYWLLIVSLGLVKILYMYQLIYPHHNCIIGL